MGNGKCVLEKSLFKKRVRTLYVHVWLIVFSQFCDIIFR